MNMPVAGKLFARAEEEEVTVSQSTSCGQQQKSRSVTASGAMTNGSMMAPCQTWEVLNRRCLSERQVEVTFRRIRHSAEIIIGWCAGRMKSVHWAYARHVGVKYTYLDPQKPILITHGNFTWICSEMPWVNTKCIKWLRLWKVSRINKY